MNTRSPAWLIFRKEMREMMRDRRVRMGAFFGPIFVIVLFLFLFGFLIDTMARPESQRIHVVPTEHEIVQNLRAQRVNVVEVEDREEGRRLIRDGRADLVLEFAEEQDQTTVHAVYDPKHPRGGIALGIIRRVVEARNRLSLETVLEERGIPIEEAEPLSLEEEQVTVGDSRTGEILIGFLPYLIVIWAFYGGMSVVADMVAGEKEKQTLETLLISPVRRTQIALGKFFALGAVCLLSSLSSLLGVVVVGLVNLPITRPLFEDGLGVSLAAAGAILLVLIPLVALFASILLAISTHARNVREAQTLITLVSFVVIIPAVFSQFIGFTGLSSARWISFVPVLNAATSIRESLLGRFDPLSLLLTVLVSAVLAAIAIRIAVFLFNREEVLVRV